MYYLLTRRCYQRFAAPLIYCETQKTMNTLIWFWQVNCVHLTDHTIKFRRWEETSKQQTNYRCCLRFVFSRLIGYFLTIQQHSTSISSVHSFQKSPYHKIGKFSKWQRAKYDNITKSMCTGISFEARGQMFLMVV